MSIFIPMCNNWLNFAHFGGADCRYNAGSTGAGLCELDKEEQTYPAWKYVSSQFFAIAIRSFFNALASNCLTRSRVM